MGLRVLRFLFLPFLLLLAVSPVWAASPALSIDSVGGKTVTEGSVRGPVTGNAVVTGTWAGSPTQDPSDDSKPLVADAGNSGFAAEGSAVTLMGAGYGGIEPYTFAWNSPVGVIEGADAPTAQLRTNGVAPGTYDVSLTVTDAAGTTAHDTVKVVVYSSDPVVLLDEQRVDSTPGTFLTASTLLFPFDVPESTTRIEASVTWGIVANDYDMRILDPDGNQATGSGNPSPEFEQAAVANPVAGRWTIAVDKWLTVTDTVHVVVSAQIAADDPRPVIDAGGPYRFLPGEPQTLTGTVSGGTEPLAVGWDTDLDGVLDATGATVTASLPEGRHMVVFKATDAGGFERRQMVSVLVASQERLARETTTVTVIGIADSGINPYHLEFSAETYPDPDVLQLTDNFTRHPSEYIPGYPEASEALPITLGQGYFPDTDAHIWTWNRIQSGNMYWIPGTKIIGAVTTGGSTGVTSGDNLHPILDDNGHGSGSASVSTGNRYGYCPTCLLMIVEALDESVVAGLSWVDISSNSFGYIGGIPIGLLVGGNEATRAAAERGQTTLFAAGNGVGNTFDVPQATYGSDQTGPDWNITVGAIRRDNNRAIVGDGIPVHISAWGDGNLPSACRTGTVGQCAFGGTSAATPYTAGVFGHVLTNIRLHLGDSESGQKPGQVVAQGLPIADSPYLNDGQLTREELREAVLKTAFPLNQENELSMFPNPLTAPYLAETNVLFEGYGAATPAGAERAIAVLLGQMEMPDRSYEDEFFALDRMIRDELYGGYDRDGDGTRESFAAATPLGLSKELMTTPEAAILALQKAAALSAPFISDQQLQGSSALRYYLHRVPAHEPLHEDSCAENMTERYMDHDDTAGDLEPCFDSRITSVVAAYRPVGIWASSVTIDAPIPAGSTVYVELFMAAETPSVIRPTGVLMAGDREIAVGAATPTAVLGSGPLGAACAVMGEACWTKFVFAFDTTRPAVHGEQLTFQVQLLGARSWAFGYEGSHASRVTILVADMPPTGLEFGAAIDWPADGDAFEETNVVALGRAAFPDLGEPDESGPQPFLNKVEVSLDDPEFGNPIEAGLTDAGDWSAPIGRLAPGTYTLYARARMDTTVSDVATSTFTVQPGPSNARVEWQVVPSGAALTGDWKPAEMTETHFAFIVPTRDYGNGNFDIAVRLVENGQVVASDKVRAVFAGSP